MKTGLSYYGGKKRLASKIVPYLPPHCVYVEPFAGGLSVMVEKGLPGTNKYSEVINDKNDHLIKFYREIRTNPAFIERLEGTLYSRSEKEKANEILKKPKEKSSKDIAWAFFVCTYQGFAKMVYKSAWGKCINPNTTNLASTWQKAIKMLPDLACRIENCYIENRCALSIIKDWDSPNTLFYCDPPYQGTDQAYLETFDMEQYRKLVDLLDKIKGSFVLSGYDSGVENPDWQRVDFETVCTASSKGRTGDSANMMPKDKDLGSNKRIDTIWISDRSQFARKDYLKHMWSPTRGYPYRDRQLQLLG